MSYGASVYIVSAPVHNGKCWRFRASDGTKHATPSDLLASLARQYWRSHERVILEGGNGYYYRDCWAIKPAGKA